jgi:mRNA-degrading endonuclease toxin of MazEF toxin-antitoxin module
MQIERGQIWWVNLDPTVGGEVLDQIRAVDKRRFDSRAGQLSASDLTEVEQALKQVLELP